MKNLLIATCVALTVCACASTPPASTPANATATARAPGCMPSNTNTWSNACSYKQQQWQQKGATSTAEALQSVAPYANVH